MQFLKRKLSLILRYFIQKIENYEYKNLSLDEDDISKKILNTISLLNIKAETDTGYETISNLHITQPYTHYHLITENFKLECADNHIIFDENLNEVFVKDLKIGQKIQTRNGLEKVRLVLESRFKSSMFDTTINHDNHRLYTNGILSHNTISASIFMLHTLLFNNDKNVMIVANIRDTTIEIVDKIKSIYSLLPFFLKPGIKTWNQKSLTFENGCRIKTSARTKTPAIGFTIDLLYLDEFAHIPSNIIEPYYTAVFPTVSAIKNSKIIITSTPNGMNLFHKLLMSAERPDGDPAKNNYKAMRVYWHEVPGRFVTYLRLNDHRLYENGITKEYVLDEVKKKWESDTEIEMKWDVDKQKYVIHVDNNDKCSNEDIRSLNILNDKGEEISLQTISEVTTWKDEAIKDIGGEDAFNQEYGLRFINSSKSLLNEGIINGLLKQKENYIYEELREFEKLKFSYEDLKWIDNDSFLPMRRKDYKIILSVDLSEGLGQDYSIINIFKLGHKSIETIEQQKDNYDSIVDFFTLEQVGIYRCNIASLKQIAELLYILAFEYFNPDNVKIVLELNNYGGTLLSEMPHVFDGKNNYGSSVFVRYKHRVDAKEEKIGLKVGENKNLLVKDYQDLMSKKNFHITNHETIDEITTFVKHVTNAGNVRYAADAGHDDCLLPDTFIKTEFGYRKIKDLKIGDFVLTHLGNYKKITNICIKEFDGDMFDVKFKGQPNLNLTYNHPLYIASNNYSRKVYKTGNYNNLSIRKWVLPGKISKKQRCVNIIEKYNINTQKVINYNKLFERDKNFAESNIKIKQIIFDEEFAKFLGLFLADGNCYKPNNTTYRISMAFNKNQNELIGWYKGYLNSLGLNLFEESRSDNGCVIIVYNKTLFELLIQCYDTETKEKIFPTYGHSLANDLSYTLEYWLLGDGWFKRSKNNRSSCNIGCTTSLQLALSMRDIALSIGKHSLINKNKRHRYEVKCKDQYWVTVYDVRPTSSSLKRISDFEISSTFDSYVKYNYKGLTYNLEVEDDNSYIANGIVVHNCVMTIVNATSIFKKNEFKELVEEYMNKELSGEIKSYIENCLKKSDYFEAVDYTQVLNIRRKHLSSYRTESNISKNWFLK